MPLQFSLFEELCRFHYRKIKKLDQIAKSIRQYFNQSTYRATRGKGSARHSDLFGLSVEEIVTFFDEIVTNKKEGYENVETVADELQELTVELISYLSTHGSPGQNQLLRMFAQRLAQTDLVVTFNWDTILDRALANQRKYEWHPGWGYGKTVREEFTSSTRRPPQIPKKYPRLLKLHGSINWVAFAENGVTKRVVHSGWKPTGELGDVVMMPPKMIKPEIWGARANGNMGEASSGNDNVSEDFYPRLWSEAEGKIANCRRLVFVGYSFPPADFAVNNMLRRAISRMKVSTGRFPEVDIVDPNAAELAKRFEQSFKIRVPIENQYLSLRNYLSSKRAG
ncbi:MAG: hypothetical protein HY067_22225 [Betaproteobacteria bacterium]|nr:hypothetical protein [Betaproteobacteria bacterium]